MHHIVTHAPGNWDSIVGDRHEFREGNDMILTRYDAPVPPVGVHGLARDSGNGHRGRSLRTLVVILVFVSGMLVGSRTTQMGRVGDQQVHSVL